MLWRISTTTTASIVTRRVRRGREHNCADSSRTQRAGLQSDKQTPANRQKFSHPPNSGPTRVLMTSAPRPGPLLSTRTNPPSSPSSEPFPLAQPPTRPPPPPPRIVSAALRRCIPTSVALMALPLPRSDNTPPDSPPIPSILSSSIGLGCVGEKRTEHRRAQRTDDPQPWRRRTGPAHPPQPRVLALLWPGGLLGLLPPRRPGRTHARGLGAKRPDPRYQFFRHSVAGLDDGLHFAPSRKIVEDVRAPPPPDSQRSGDWG